MVETKGADRFVVEGYSFYTEKDAVLAESESRKVEYLRERLDFDKPENILTVYNKAVEERVFKSPVGHYFLKNLQDYLLEQEEIENEKILPIPMYVSFDQEFRKEDHPARERVKPAPQKEPPKNADKKAQWFPVSVILNIVLVIAVIAMFAITLNSDQPNILNYEQNLLNKYASWEQELTDREQVIKEKERNLDIN